MEPLVVSQSLLWVVGIASTTVTTLVGLFFRSVVTHLAGIDSKLTEHLKQTTTLVANVAAHEKRLDKHEEIIYPAAVQRV